MQHSRYRAQLDCALQLAALAEQKILPWYQRCAVSHKSDGSEVTEADRGAEQAIREHLAQHFPHHAVLGEEFGGPRAADDLWIIDPLDGTSAFALGLPLFGTLIAYLDRGRPVVGVIHFPVLGETVYAAEGEGCWFRRGADAPERVQVAASVPLHEAVVSASGMHASDIWPAADGAAWCVSPLLQRVRKFRFCGDCMQHALICRGNLHAAIDTIMQPWDIAALLPCIHEAGGVASSAGGQRDGLVFAGSLASACSEAVLEEVLAVLNGK